MGTEESSLWDFVRIGDKHEILRIKIDNYPVIILAGLAPNVPGSRSGRGEGEDEEGGTCSLRDAKA